MQIVNPAVQEHLPLVGLGITNLVQRSKSPSRQKVSLSAATLEKETSRVGSDSFVVIRAASPVLTFWQEVLPRSTMEKPEQ